VRPEGSLDFEALAVAAEARPKAICIQAANNETGVLFPIARAAALAHAHGALLIVDAAQALGRIPLDVREEGFDLAAFSAHKLYGPKGAGALFVRGGLERTSLEALIPGGGQEGGLRAGTLNVAGIVGFGEACRLAGLEMAGEAARLCSLRDRLEAGLMSAFPGIRVNGAGDRLPNTSNLVFPGVDARILIRDMHDVAVSTRSACASGSAEASHVLKAMGLGDEDAFASIRFSLGRSNTEAEIDAVVAKATASYRKLAGNGPLA
jgi:cysteine desulfurase